MKIARNDKLVYFVLFFDAVYDFFFFVLICLRRDVSKDIVYFLWVCRIDVKV